MYKNIFDTHAHYEDEQFDCDRDELLSSFPENGISGVVTCGTDIITSEKSIALAEKYPFIYAAVVFHALNLDSLTAGWCGDIKKLAAHQDVSTTMIYVHSAQSFDDHVGMKNPINRLVI